MLPSIVRTYVPLIVGYLVTLAGHVGLHISGDTTITGLVTVAIAGVYYLVVRIIEQRFPWVGNLLGYARAPKYKRDVDLAA